MAEKKNRNSLQRLIGFQTFTKYGVKTDKSEFILYHVEPTNISVLPPEVIANKMHDLAMVLSVFSLINRISKAISDHGFMAHRLEKPEIKRMLGLYFGTSITADYIPDIEGEEYVKENADGNN